MGSPAFTPEARYATLVEALLGRSGTPQIPEVTGPRKRFGSSALKVDGKIFAMLVRGRLVVKLPGKRVDSLVVSGVGVRFDGGRGKPMKEWLALEPGAERGWLPLAEEAKAFVASKR